MRAAVAHRGRITVDDVDDPVPGSGQLLIAVRACGICGSDLHMVQSQAAQADTMPSLIPGHEFVGEVIDFGPNTTRAIKPGTLVTSIPYLDTIAGPQLIGLSPHADGGLAERMNVQEHRLIPVPEAAIVEHMAIAEPLAVGVHAVEAAALCDVDIALVIGCGPVGLAVIASLKAGGHGPVIAADFSEKRRRLAEAMGADVVIDPAAESPYSSWAEMAGRPLPVSPLWTGEHRSNTVVFECVGSPGVLQTIIDSAPPHSRVIVVGVCQQPDTIIPVVALVKELSVRFVFAYRPLEFAQAVDWIATARIDVTPMITATWSLEDAPSAFAALQPPSQHCKILLTPDGT